ncbi:MAG: hypothetical protein KKC03_13690, partial [Bacteroidetes bacterium]|nr:hypothetical protein [Bacteroidota bacterium]
MNTIDWGHVMETDENWFEDINDQCPFCDEGRKNFDELTDDERREVIVKMVRDNYSDELEALYDERKSDTDPDFDDSSDDARIDALAKEYYDTDLDGGTDAKDFYEDDREKFEFYCEECTEGRFEIMWNTGFEVEVHGNFDDKRMTAWKHGFLLVEYPRDSNDHWLLAGGCGYDFSWQLAYCRWKVQGWLSPDERSDVLCSGGHVFLHGEKKHEFLAYLKEYIPTPADGTRSWCYDQQKVMDIEVYNDDSKRDKHANGLAKRPKMDVTLSQLSYMIPLAKLPPAPLCTEVLTKLREATGLDSWELFACSLVSMCPPDKPIEERMREKILELVEAVVDADNATKETDDA